MHLASWPAADLSLIDAELSAQMALARRLVELGRSARSGASVRTRQPLRRALIGAAGFDRLPAELRSLVAAELNVSELSNWSSEAGELVDYAVKPNFRNLGRRFGRADARGGRRHRGRPGRGHRRRGAGGPDCCGR